MNHYQNSITELVLKLKESNTAYRNGKPIISDTEYDNLLDEFKNSVSAEEYERVRLTLMEDDEKNVRHPFLMGSLDKIKAFDNSASISKWILQTIPNTDSENDGIFISSKIDGCSARLTYIDGKLVGAATRGKGEYGADIFDKVHLFAPNTLDHKFSGEVRGEITLTRQTLDDLSEMNPDKDYKNLRNGTVGLLKGLDSTEEELSCLRFFAYEIMGNTGLSKKEQFDKLKTLGFETALSQCLTDVFNYRISFDDNTIDDVLMKVYNEFSEKAPFDIDGLVVSDLNDHDVFENVMIPSKTVAVKFNQMTADTKLIDIIWNVSKGGRLSPVGVVEGVELGGTTVVNVTLNNMRMMKEMGLAYGCTVTILKSGDVIPKIVGVRHDDVVNEVEITYPERCPSCGEPLRYDEDCLYPICENQECGGIVYNKILHFLNQLGIKHVGLKTIAEFGLKRVSDIVDMGMNGGAVKKKFYNEVHKLMFGASKEELLSAFDYDGVSSKIIEKMVSHYGFETLISSDFESLKENKPFGVGDKFLKKFCDGFAKIRNEFEYIIHNDRYYGNSKTVANKHSEVQNGILSGKGFVVTGALNTMSRKNFEETVIKNGGIYQSSVSKKTNYLVCNDLSTATTKVKKAESLGVIVIDENKFLNMLRDGSDGFSMF